MEKNTDALKVRAKDLMVRAYFLENMTYAVI